MTTLQTLDRGLRLLDEVAAHPGGISVAELGALLELHRTICYRVVATLAEHGLVHRGEDGRVRLAAGVLGLAARFAPALRSAARPVLARLAVETGATSYLAVAEQESCVVVLTHEPPTESLRVAYRVGARHPLTRGASGLAILAGRPESADDPEPVRRARAQGHAVTRGELEPGAVGVGCGLGFPGDHEDLECSVGVVALAGLDAEAAAVRVRAAAAELRRVL